VPKASRDRTRRSSDTDGSPVSIFAMRDWLDRRDLARSTCVRRQRRRQARGFSASRNFNSMYAAS
jgi:hypothetical protein